MSDETGHPPRPPFALVIGVTGHRSARMPQGVAAEVAARVDALMDVITEEALAIARTDAAMFADVPPRLSVVSALADGADQIVAEAARARGFALDAILPFERGEYGAGLEGEGSEQAMHRLAGEASCLFEVTSDEPDESYWLAGRATVAHADILLAIWDGEASRGRGGTADVVQLAIARGTPVIHLPLESRDDTRLLWSAFDPAVVTTEGTRSVARTADRETIARVLGALLAPPGDVRERRFLDRFYGETAINHHWRVEYPALRALAGTRKLSRGDISARPQRRYNIAEWASYRDACVGRHGVGAPLDALEQAYGWADSLASHFAQTYRSGHIFNFVFAALSVLIGVSGIALPGGKIALALLELAIIVLVLLNTSAGVRRCWHQRWLDYRQLAERLRPMRSLKILGVAAPDPPGNAAEPIARRWTEWYAAAMWRTVGCPAGMLDERRSIDLARSIAECELRPQIAYNRKVAHEGKQFDERLEMLATLLFLLTVVGCVTLVVGLVFAPVWIARHNNLFTLISTGFPAVGTAIFGIRVQGDYGGTAMRSLSTANQLERIADELDLGPDLGRAADLCEQAARVMLADLGAWRMIHEQHELSVG